IYGALPAAWHALRDADDLCAWADAGATMPARLLGVLFDTMPQLARSDVALMPLSDREALMRAIVPALDRQPEFSRAPTWEGTPVETGALARMRSHPLVAAVAARNGNSVATRMVARLAELAMLLLDLADASLDERPTSWVHSLALASGEGLGAVQTARGLLLHRVRLADGRVAHYQIIAPTEWNFHPDGALVRGLRGLVGDDREMLGQAARLAVQALDPCVACTIEIGHA
ncbi:MAG TPA: nickel-dependent hydrogenase large subunit, partial [Casimicrobiaceae bacterium]|nr:nickel-dependent hydrogenase large subunit [Casimicrobiaceae bacterium]